MNPLDPDARDLPPDQLKALYDAHGLWKGAWVTIQSSTGRWRGVLLEPIDQSGREWVVARKHIQGKGFIGTERIARGMIENPSLLERIAWEFADAEKDDSTKLP
jgi:hypothetical protein